MGRRYKIEDVGCIRIYRDPQTEEYVVKPKGALTDNDAYFTNNLDDARDTANAAVGHAAKSNCRCPDCGLAGEIKGHQTCQYPQN